MSPHRGMTVRGVHRFVTSPDAAAEGLRTSGYRVGVIGPQADLQAVLADIGRALALPGYFGRNLDALWDCLGDLDAPSALVWSGWQHHARREPERWASLMQVFTERAELDPPFAVVLV